MTSIPDPQQQHEAILQLFARVQRLEALVDQLVGQQATGLHQQGFASGSPISPAPGTAATAVQGVPPDIVDAIRSGKKVLAIKLYRDYTGLGLREAKEAVDVFEKALS